MHWIYAQKFRAFDDIFVIASQADKFRSAWQSINSSKLYHKNSSKSLNFVILTCLCHTLLFSCHTERSEVSTNLKCDFSALRYILNSWIFRSQSSLKMTMEIFRFLAKTQNDKIFAILICLTEHSFCHKFCHTGQSEVSINLKHFKRLLKFFG